MKLSLKHLFLASALITAISLILPCGATAQTLETLHSFAKLANDNAVTNADGFYPQCGLFLAGNTLYGTAPDGGTNGSGTVFAINTDGTGFRLLHTFSADTGYPAYNSDGVHPLGGLNLIGNTLYGVATGGGSSDSGTVFSLNTDGTDFTTIYNFTNGTDGSSPEGELLVLGNTLYGTATFGGNAGWGTVFSVNTNGQDFTTLYTFTNGTDGGFPEAGLILGGNTLYSTTSQDGSSNNGTVFAINPDGTGFRVVHVFTALSALSPTNTSTNTDGAFPKCGLVFAGGMLYGTASEGGDYGVGTVFGVNTNGAGFTTLHSFTALNAIFNSDGCIPFAGLVLSGTTLYGTAHLGGKYGFGTVFSVSTSGTDFTPLSSLGEGTYGAWPEAPLTLSGSELYGTTVFGGNGNTGAVFDLSLSGVTVQQGSLQVEIEPIGAVGSGAQWQVDGGASFPTEQVVNGLSVGKHTVSFSTVNGWKTPANQTVSISANSTKEITGTYVALPGAGSLQVLITPASAVTAGARWQVDGGPLQISGATVANLATGNHKVSYTTITGWVTPADQTVSIVANSTVGRLGIYLPETGSLQVTISPAALTAAAQWQVDAGTVENSGQTLSNLNVGNHTLSFSTVGGWTTPANQTISIKSKLLSKAEGIYTFSAPGIYNGLFMQRATTEETAGMLSDLDVTATGTYTGKLLIGGRSYSLSGGFNGSDQISEDVQRTANLGGPLTLAMTVNWNYSPPNITGTVSGNTGGAWTADLTAELAAKESSSAEYTAWVLPGVTPPEVTPPGYGYMLITNHAGAATLSVTLADGTKFSQEVPVSGNGDLAVYGNLYSNSGLLLGWLGLESGAPSGILAWIKPASRSTTIYASGFTNLNLEVQGSAWANPLPHTAAIDFSFGQLDISGGNLPSQLTFNVAVSNNNALGKLRGSPTNSLTGSINPKTGLLTITFGNGAGKATTAGTGAALQNVNGAAGFFLGKTNAGTILLNN